MTIGKYVIKAIVAFNIELKDKHKIEFPKKSIHISELTEERAARDYFNYADTENVDDAILRLNEIKVQRSKEQCVTFLV